MDGASYHKRNLYPAPTTRWLKADMQQWLCGNENTYFTKIEECDLGSNSDHDTASKEEEEEKGALDVDSEDWDE
ncbi:hypothetical protein F441_21076 [Phytophthora nicotianae CJ01A1]|uniref:Uncharacterized protein n=1 Tax=Phytophthora nicotianae CJ01A1 TaxID=1317063 RepID=W2VTZ8_PHYNI|nr:hypothetical protein F441_21076 [Phytophthora nicotianae CJ01A1]